MPSARAQAPSHRATIPRRARWLAAILFLAVSAPAMAASPTAAAAPADRYAKLERFALRLVNCTRTGGWVRPNGTCDGRGSGRYSAKRKPLRLHAGISDEVARPYARRLARADACQHGLAGSSIAARFRAAGYTEAKAGESIGCSNGFTLRRMLIRTHRMMQSERSYNGWHWRNMKNREFKSVGIGVAKRGSETRVVYDFYGR